MSKKSKENQNENDVKSSIETNDNKSIVGDILSNTQISSVMISLMKSVIPNLTAGAIKPTDVYYDKDEGITVITFMINGETDYKVIAKLRFDDSWIIDLKITNLTTNNSRRFSYTEEINDNHEEDE